MKFVERIEELQKENEGIIVIVKNGIFFIGIGKDAIILNELLGLKLTCMKPKQCKVGFLVKNVEKYIKLLSEKGKSFKIFIKNDKDEMEEIYRFIGDSIYDDRECLECVKCENRKETEEDIIERIKNFGK